MRRLVEKKFLDPFGLPLPLKGSRLGLVEHSGLLSR